MKPFKETGNRNNQKALYAFAAHRAFVLLRLIIQGDEKVQIPGKGDPQRIGDQQPGGPLVDAAELADGDEDHGPQEHEHQKRPGIVPFAEEGEGPEEVHRQLRAVEKEGGGLERRIAAVNKPGGHAHQDEENGPHHREKPAGRGQGRFNKGFVQLHGISGNQGGQPSHQADWDHQCNDQADPFSFHPPSLPSANRFLSYSIHPGCFYESMGLSFYLVFPKG